jgi:hypothetical protein
LFPGQFPWIFFDSVSLLRESAVFGFCSSRRFHFAADFTCPLSVLCAHRLSASVRAARSDRKRRPIQFLPLTSDCAVRQRFPVRKSDPVLVHRSAQLCFSPPVFVAFPQPQSLAPVELGSSTEVAAASIQLLPLVSSLSTRQGPVLILLRA